MNKSLPRDQLSEMIDVLILLAKRKNPQTDRWMQEELVPNHGNNWICLICDRYIIDRKLPFGSLLSEIIIEHGILHLKNNGLLVFL